MARQVSSFGALLKELRLAEGLTQEALAERAGLSAKAISDLERNPDRTPRLDSVALLAGALQLAAEDKARLLAAARPSPEPAPTVPPAAQPQRVLPRPFTSLIGRAGVATAVVSLLLRDEIRLLTLAGPGGVGKTRLAIEVAARAAGAFADGTAFVDLSPLRDSSLVLPTIAWHLGVAESDELLPRVSLSASLRARRMLLLLDNLEQLPAAHEDIVALLEDCPGVVVLATSRVPLRVRGERVYRVAPLELPPESAALADLEHAAAVALFLDRARAAGVDLELGSATGPAVAAICRRLDGLPLALELAAAWAPLLPPEELLARLEHRLPLLAGGPADLPTRQRTMRDTIAWSYDLLQPAEQRLFRRLAVFAGRCGLDAALAICAERDDAQTVLAGLASLVDKSLLRREGADAGGEEPRLIMLETVREYGLGCLEESGESARLQARHAAHFLAMAEDAAKALRGPDQLAWTARLEHDHDNLRAALAWAGDQGEGTTGLGLVGALWYFWSVHGHVREGRRWLAQMLELPATGATPTDHKVRLNALLGAAMLALEAGELDQAATTSMTCLSLARKHGGLRALVDALNAAGTIARQRSAYAEAMTYLDEALRRAEATGYPEGEVQALTEIAMVTFLTGDVTQGKVQLERSLSLHRDLGDTRGLAAVLRDLGWLAWHAGDSLRGEALRDEALGLFRVVGDTGQVAEVLWGLGISAQARGDYARAIAMHEESLTLRRARGDERGAAQVLSALAQVALHRRDLPAARMMLMEALATLQRLEDRWARAMGFALLGHVELVAGDLDRAREHLGAAAALYINLGNLLYLPWCFEGFAGLAAAEGRATEAARLCGVRETLLASVGGGLPPVDPAGYAHTLATVHSVLADPAFTTAYEAGRALSPEDAIAALAVGGSC